MHLFQNKKQSIFSISILVPRYKFEVNLRELQIIQVTESLRVVHVGRMILVLCTCKGKFYKSKWIFVAQDRRILLVFWSLTISSRWDHWQQGETLIDRKDIRDKWSFEDFTSLNYMYLKCCWAACLRFSYLASLNAKLSTCTSQKHCVFYVNLLELSNWIGKPFWLSS